MTRPALFLHVGPHKTGSTSIQHALAALAPKLRAQGVEVYHEDRKAAPCNAYHLAHDLLRPEVHTPMRLRHPNLAQGAGERRRHLRIAAARPTQALVVSSEAFAFLRSDADADRVSDLFEPVFSGISACIVRRAPEDWRRSWQAQLGRAQNDYLAAYQDAPADRRVDAPWYSDFDAIYDFWAKLGSCHVLDYEAEMNTRGSILPAFFNWLGLPEKDHPDDLFLNRTKVKI